MVKNPLTNAGDTGSIPGSRRSPGGGIGYPLQHSCLENPHGQRSLVGYSPWGRKESDTTERPNTAQQWLGPWGGVAPQPQKVVFLCGQFFLTADLRLSSCRAKCHDLAEGLLERSAEDVLPAKDSAPAKQPTVPGNRVTRLSSQRTHISGLYKPLRGVATEHIAPHTQTCSAPGDQLW